MPPRLSELATNSTDCREQSIFEFCRSKPRLGKVLAQINTEIPPCENARGGSG